MPPKRPGGSGRQGGGTSGGGRGAGGPNAKAIKARASAAAVIAVHLAGPGGTIVGATAANSRTLAAQTLPTAVLIGSQSYSNSGVGGSGTASSRKNEQAYKSLRDHVEDMGVHFQRQRASLPQLRVKLDELTASLSGYHTREDVKLFGLRKREIRNLKRLIRDIEERKDERKYMRQVWPLIERDNALVASTGVAGASAAGTYTLLPLLEGTVTGLPQVGSSAVSVIDEFDLTTVSYDFDLTPEIFITDSVDRVKSEEKHDVHATTSGAASVEASAVVVASRSITARTTWAPLTSLAFTAPYLLDMMPTIVSDHQADSDSVVAEITDISMDPAASYSFNSGNVMSYTSTIGMDDADDGDAPPTTSSGPGSADTSSATSATAAASKRRGAPPLPTASSSSSSGRAAQTKQARKRRVVAGSSSSLSLPSDAQPGGNSSTALIPFAGANSTASTNYSNSIVQARHELTEQFLSTFTPDKQQPKYINSDLCPRCGRDMMLLPFEGRSVCLRCKTWVEYFDSALNLAFGEDTQTTTTHEYDRPKHLCKFMQQWHRNNVGPPDRVYIDLIRYYDNIRDTCVHDVKPTPIRDVLTQLGLKEWRGYAERVSNRLQNIPVAQLSDATIKLFTKMFDQIQPIFAQVKEKRNNMLTIYYILHKLSRLIGLPQLATCFPLLKVGILLWFC